MAFQYSPLKLEMTEPQTNLFPIIYLLYFIDRKLVYLFGNQNCRKYFNSTFRSFLWIIWRSKLPSPSKRFLLFSCTHCPVISSNSTERSVFPTVYLSTLLWLLGISSLKGSAGFYFSFSSSKWSVERLHLNVFWNPLKCDQWPTFLTGFMDF